MLKSCPQNPYRFGLRNRDPPGELWVTSQRPAKRCSVLWFLLRAHHAAATSSTGLRPTLTLAAMPPKTKAIEELGGVEAVDAGFRAHVGYRSALGKLVHIRAPRRQSRYQADADLAQIRAAGAVGNTREEGLQIMAAEARRIQTSAQFEEQARVEMQQAAEEQQFADYLSEEESDDEPWSMAPPRDEEVAATPSQRAPLTRDEADRALQEFRPIRAFPGDLEHILASRADPNQTPATRNITPLRKVLVYARDDHVDKMRDLLLKYGVHESQEENDQWATCRNAWLCERIRQSGARRNPREYDPCAAAMERNC
jgi:hypothetical protein